MVDSKYSKSSKYTSSKISIETIIKIPKMLILIPDHLQTKKMCKHEFKQLSFVIIYVPDRYKTQKICDKAVLQNGRNVRVCSGLI